jgi:hypothetical protein
MRHPGQHSHLAVIVINAFISCLTPTKTHATSPENIVYFIITIIRKKLLHQMFEKTYTSMANLLHLSCHVNTKSTAAASNCHHDKPQISTCENQEKSKCRESKANEPRTLWTLECWLYNNIELAVLKSYLTTFCTDSSSSEKTKSHSDWITKCSSGSLRNGSQGIGKIPSRVDTQSCLKGYLDNWPHYYRLSCSQ